MIRQKKKHLNMTQSDLIINLGPRTEDPKVEPKTDIKDDPQAYKMMEINDN